MREFTLLSQLLLLDILVRPMMNSSPFWRRFRQKDWSKRVAIAGRSSNEPVISTFCLFVVRIVAVISVGIMKSSNPSFITHLSRLKNCFSPSFQAFFVQLSVLSVFESVGPSYKG